MRFFTENSPASIHLAGLCQALADDAEFQGMLRDIAEFKRDDVAQKQLAELTSRGNVIRAKQTRHEDLIPREVEEFEELRAEFLSNPVAAGYVD